MVLTFDSRSFGSSNVENPDFEDVLEKVELVALGIGGP